MIQRQGRRKWRFVCGCGYWSQWRSKKLAKEDGARHLTNPWQYPFQRYFVRNVVGEAVQGYFRRVGYRTLEQQRIEYEVMKFREKLKEL